MTFEQWMEKVDLALEAICGLSTFDLTDQRYHDWYDEEMTPADVARETLKREGFPESLLF